MAQKTRIRRIGNSLGMILPKEALAHLKVEEGQEVYLATNADGSLSVASSASNFDQQMAVVKDVMRRYHNALRALAK